MALSRFFDSFGMFTIRKLTNNSMARVCSRFGQPSSAALVVLEGSAEEVVTWRTAAVTRG